jgi:prepilin-type N-terminal cleavage/methylation domain-containing protein/prepilin-type processing-associated H-X9-DG protein
MKRRGFTLIELLVVIAIIAILAAILFPVFARARAKARQNNCLSNVKQIMLAVLMYVQDYDEFFPNTAGGQTMFTTILPPYTKNTQLFVCPEDLNGGTSQWFGISYSYTWDIVQGQEGIFGSPPVGLRNLQNPANTIVVADGAPNGYGFWYNVAKTYPYSWDGLAVRHNNGVNGGWADGHAKFVSTGPQPACAVNGTGCDWYPIPESNFTWSGS